MKKSDGYHGPKAMREVKAACEADVIIVGGSGGFAAGIAAAMAVEKGIAVRDIPYAELKEKLLAQNAILP